MTEPDQKGALDPTARPNTIRRPFVDQLKRFWGWLLALIGLIIITLTKSYLAEIVWPERKLAMMDTTLTRVWNYSDTVAQNKALVDLSDDAKTIRFQLHLVGRLALLVRNHRRLQNTKCPSSSERLGTNDQQALKIVVDLGRQLEHPANRFYVFPQAPPLELAALMRFDSADLSLADFNNANLRMADFSKSCLFKTSFEHANLDTSNFTLARLDSTVFRRAEMRGALLKSVTSRGAQFRETDLHEATFNFARLKLVNFSGSDLTCAYLAGAITDSLNLSGVVLAWADFFGTALARVQAWQEIDSLKSAYLVGVTGLGPSQLALARNQGAYVDGPDQERWGLQRDQNCRGASSLKRNATLVGSR
jgi:uncharacterized protein YjbI with pentapeptide repeats